MELFLLFSRTDVAKEYRILGKWTKKMSKIRLDETLLCKIRRIYYKKQPSRLTMLKFLAISWLLFTGTALYWYTVIPFISVAQCIFAI
jgi:hypothetical protein